MEKNKQQNQEDAFLKKYLQEIKLEAPKSNFTATIMETILAEEKQAVLKTEPLISKKVWLLVAGFIAVCLWFLFKEEKDSLIELPKLNLDFLASLQMPNISHFLTASNTALYAIFFFTLMMIAQVFFLKNHLNKRFE